MLLELAEQGEAVGRVYEWSGPWVSLGRFQRPERALRPGCEVPWVMRPTGGKAVLHGHDLTIGLALPLTGMGLSERESRSVGAVYRRIVGPLVQAIQGAGGNAVLAEETPFVRSAGKTADCFAHIAPNDIVDPKTGHKVCGCALRLTAKAVLLQASLPVEMPLVEVKDVFEASHLPMGRLEMTAADLAESLSRALA